MLVLWLKRRTKFMNLNFLLLSSPCPRDLYPLEYISLRNLYKQPNFFSSIQMQKKILHLILITCEMFTAYYRTTERHCSASQKGECRFDVFKPAVCKDNCTEYYTLRVVVDAWEKNTIPEEEACSFGRTLVIVVLLLPFIQG